MLVAALAVGAALTAGAILLVGLLSSRLETTASTAAALRASDVSALAAAGTLPRVLAFPGEETALVQVVDQHGTVIASTSNIDGEPPITTRRPQPGDQLDFTLDVSALGDAHSMRIVALTTATSSGLLTAYAGESLDSATDTTRAVATVLAIGLPFLVAFAAAITWWSVGRTLRPVRQITDTLAEITTSDLHRRVPETSGRDEIGQLATTVNATLARLDESVERQRRFVADASHELRGPLAALRADLEISLAHPGPTEWPVVARDSLGDIDRLQGLTEGLLVLARLDAQAPSRREAVDVGRIVAEELLDVRRGDITVTASEPDVPAVVRGDSAQLRRMIRNLISNAERHADRRLDVTTQLDASKVAIIVADDGPGIPAGERERVFERFVRLDAARTADEGGTGLGLAIVHDIATAHGATVRITDTVPNGTTVTVELPRGR